MLVTCGAALLIAFPVRSAYKQFLDVGPIMFTRSMRADYRAICQILAYNATGIYTCTCTCVSA